jgi:tripartite-type tricarboxylate transporter receptor subunit TctC
VSLSPSTLARGARARRGIAMVAVLAAAGPVAGHAAQDIAFPVKPVRIIVPLAPGGGNDAIARLVAARFPERLGQAGIVDNRPGANGIVGTEIAARAAPDGYTMLVANQTHVILGDLYSKLSFDPVRDFVPVSLAAVSPLVIAVHPSQPFTTLAEMVSWMRANPGKLNYGTSGVGSPPHLAGELLAQAAKVQMTPIVFKGIGPAMTAVLGNEIQMTIPNLLVSTPHAKAGRLRVLAVTSAKRTDASPDIPAVSETFPGYEAAIWFGFLAPRATPPALVDRLNREIVAVLRIPEVRQQVVGIGAETIASTPAEFAAVMKSDAERLGRLVRSRGIRAEGQ